MGAGYCRALKVPRTSKVRRLVDANRVVNSSIKSLDACDEQGKAVRCWTLKPTTADTVEVLWPGLCCINLSSRGNGVCPYGLAHAAWLHLPENTRPGAVQTSKTYFFQNSGGRSRKCNRRNLNVYSPGMHCTERFSENEFVTPL